MEFSEGLEKIGLFAFYQSAIESVVFPASLRMLSQGAFARCKFLANAKFEEGLEVLGTDARADNGEPWAGVFQESGVEQVVLPRTLRRIEPYTFKGCGHLQSVKLPDGLESVGEHAFCESGLRSIAIPAVLNTVDSSAFASCWNLLRVEFMEGRETLGKDKENSSGWNTLLRNKGIKVIVLPKTLRQISPNIFAGCDSLRTVQVGKGCPVDIKNLVGGTVNVLRK